MVGRLHHWHSKNGAGIDGLDADFSRELAEVGLELGEERGGEFDALGRARALALLRIDDVHQVGEDARHS